MPPAAPRTAPVPAALRPRSTNPAPPRVVERGTAADQRQTYHLAIVVPDERLQRLLRDNCYVLGPVTAPFRLAAHVVRNDPRHKAARLEHHMRWALTETGLLAPEDVGFVTTVQVELGWSGHEGDTA